ncbi:uncharacterized protein ACA1_124010 [Acanthamoeba castellanii str. Neff]|uniref:Cyclic nucleotide-binding domain-containing protein n=1 Tax=Acanthamoeba castellanii (strain ATCC 30010 / Neff) TaxID=1257118 RepID=L8H3L3_ACACF|nr:uncharacterized protein ACA1_124010 [Acanthamoeba castellanii str. Neff]ELR19800.1 hypothetical protein ACA1_124010 [Acanthamoeba castellanii str. Neff]
MLWVDRFRFRCRPTPTSRPLSSAYVALAKVVLRSGSKRKRAQVAATAAADGADASAAQAWTQRRLLLPSLAPGRTVPADLNNLPESIKKKLYIVHCSGIPEYVETETSEGNKLRVKVTHLKRPQTEETVALAVSKYAEGYSRASLLFRMFCDVWYFRNLSPARVSRLFSACTEETRQPGDVVVKSGEQRRLVRSLGRGQFFGESALGCDHQAKRTATVVARTGVTLLSLPSAMFRESQKQAELAYVHATPVEVDLERVRKYRQFVCSSLCRSYLFSSLYGEQLEAIAASIDDGAFAMALNMRKAHFLPSKRAFLSFLKCGGYVLQASDIELMWSDLTRKLARSGRKINRDYYHAKMISYLRRKAPEAVRRTLEEMEDNGVTPNSYTYYLLILVDDVDGFF